MEIKHRDRVFDFAGGPLQIVRVLSGPDDTVFEWKLLEVVDYLPLAHGLALPAGLTFPVSWPDKEPFAEIEIGVLNGRPACVGVRAIGPNELTTLILRKLPGIGGLLRVAVPPQIVRVTRLDGELFGERHVHAPDFYGFGDGARELQADAEGLVAETRRRTITPEFLREVADVYRTARAEGISTQRAIQDKWPTSEANARRWVALARKHGALGLAPDERRAGEKVPKTKGTSNE